MNLALLDPFELHSELPEMIEDKLQPASSVVACAFNRRGNLLAGGCSDGNVVVWDFDTHGVARVLTGHTARVTSVSWTRSSQRLLTSSMDGQLIVWQVLSGSRLQSLSLGHPITHAQLHPRKKDVCLACVVSDAAAARGGGAVYLQNLRTQERLAIVDALDGADDEGGGGGKREGPTVACFNGDGKQVLVGTSRGVVRVFSADSRQELTTVQVSAGSSIKSMDISRSGRSLVLNCADRVIRAMPLGRLHEGPRAAGRELQDVVNRAQWSHASFSADGEHVIGASAAGTEQKLYIWDLHGHLIKMLDGPQDGAIHFACHPTRPMVACCARSGAVYIWTKQYCENWSAFAPDFKELEENEEYEEREDEFDIQPAQTQLKEEEAEEIIDVVTMDTSELAHRPDEDDDEEELIFLPTRPDPDDEASGAATGADSNGAEGDADRYPKPKKRKPPPLEASKGAKRPSV